MTEEHIDPRKMKNLRALATLFGRIPANLVGVKLPGVLAAMEARRVVMAAGELGGLCQVSDGREVVPLAPDGIEVEGDHLSLGGLEGKLLWGVLHRSQLPAFCHILLAFAQGEGGVRHAVLCAQGSPLLDPSGLRMMQKHLLAGDSQEGAAAFFKELEGVAAMLAQGNPIFNQG